MSTKEMDLLEKVWTNEVETALRDTPFPYCYQTKSKLAEKLTDEGYLQRVKFTIPGRFPVNVEGYGLTHLGRFTYCSQLP